MDDALGVLVPEEDVAAVGAGNDELAARAVKVDALYWKQHQQKPFKVIFCAQTFKAFWFTIRGIWHLTF